MKAGEKSRIRGIKYACGCILWVPHDLKPGETFPFTCLKHSGSEIKQTFEGYSDRKKEAADE